MIKKKGLLCVCLIILLCLCGCVNLRYYESLSVVTLPEQPTPPVVQQTQPAAQTPVQTPQPTLPQMPETAPTQAPVGNANAANWSKTEIVAFINAAFQLVKSDTSSFILEHTVEHAVSLLKCSSSEMLTMAQTLIDKLNVTEKTEYTVAGGVATVDGESVSVHDVIPSQNGSFAIKETDVASARASFDGENVIILLTLCDDTANKEQPVPALLGDKLPYLSFRGQEISPYSVQSADLQYTDISVVAGIDSQNRLVTVTFSASVSGKATGGIGVMTADALFMGTVKEVRVFTYE